MLFWFGSHSPSSDTFAPALFSPSQRLCCVTGEMEPADCIAQCVYIGQLPNGLKWLKARTTGWRSRNGEGISMVSLHPRRWKLSWQLSRTVLPSSSVGCNLSQDLFLKVKSSAFGEHNTKLAFWGLFLCQAGEYEQFLISGSSQCLEADHHGCSF